MRASRGELSRRMRRAFMHFAAHNSSLRLRVRARAQTHTFAFNNRLHGKIALRTAINGRENSTAK